MSSGNYVLLGPPGSGKSTQAELLRKNLGLVHIDIGSELRAAAEEDTPLGREINDTIHLKHSLTSDAIMKAVFENAIKRVPASQGILLDGAPRRASQIDEVEAVLRSFGRSIDKAIFINLSEEQSIERISKRYLCFGCHRPYILDKDTFSQETPCSVCGGKIGQRKDDTVEGVRKRHHIFHSETLPVIEYFANHHLLLRVDGNQVPEKIFQDTISQLGALSQPQAV